MAWEWWLTLLSLLLQQHFRLQATTTTSTTLLQQATGLTKSPSPILPLIAQLTQQQSPSGTGQVQQEPFSLPLPSLLLGRVPQAPAPSPHTSTPLLQR